VKEIVKKQRLDLHDGYVLVRELSDRYPTVKLALMELFANGIDSGAKSVRVAVNMRTCNLAVRDDGNGMSEEEFDRRLQSIGKSFKEDKSDQIGQFALGLIGFMGKCKCYFLTTTPRSNPRAYKEWKFETDVIREQHDVEIPMKDCPDLVFSPTIVHEAKRPWWRTEVRVEDFTRDRSVAHFALDELINDIYTEYNEAMKEQGTTIYINFIEADGKTEKKVELHAREFNGTRLPEVEKKSKDGGRTVFSMYLSRNFHKVGRPKKPRVLVGVLGDVFRFHFEEFVSRLTGGLKLSEECVRAITSGLFEGEILTENAKLASGRKSFVNDDALFDFATSIEEWYHEYGAELTKSVVETRKNARWQVIGRKTLQILHGLVTSDKFASIHKAFEGFKFGHIGKGHHKDADSMESGIKAISLSGTKSIAPTGRESGWDRKKPDPGHEREEHIPMAVAGPRGEERKYVRHGSIGLILKHEILPAHTIYEFDREHGVFCFNVKHPMWMETDEAGDKALEAFQLYVLVNVLSIESRKEDERDLYKIAFEDSAVFYVPALTTIFGQSKPLVRVQKNKKAGKSLAFGKKVRSS